MDFTIHLPTFGPLASFAIGVFVGLVVGALALLCAMNPIFRAIVPPRF